MKSLNPVRGYDLFGNTAVVKFSRCIKGAEKRSIALDFLKKNKSVRTVLEKEEKFSGRLRTQKTKYIAGEKTKEALYKENGCAFRLNLDSCYFSPRLANERVEIARMVRKGEGVLVMFGGVAPFAIVIGKISEAERVVSVELGRECSKYAVENVRRNKLQDRVEIVQGDVRRRVPKLKERFDRIVMARPNLKDSFLDVAFPKVKKGGIVHYYGFYESGKAIELRNLIIEEAKKAKRKIKILRIKEAGEIGVRKYRYRADIKIIS